MAVNQLDEPRVGVSGAFGAPSSASDDAGGPFLMEPVSVSECLLWASYFLYCQGWLTEIFMLLAILLATWGQPLTLNG